MSEALEQCLLCGSADHRQLYITRDRHYGIPGEYRIVKCKQCGIVFLNPMPTDSELSELYPKDYYAYQEVRAPSRKMESFKSLLGFRIHTLDPSFSVPGVMLDLGCGTGWFMLEMRAKGWTACGVEINRSAAELGKRVSALDIAAGTLQQAAFPASHFDYIRSNHSFEHIASPHETLEEIHRVLRSDGKLLIGVPNIDSFNARMFGKYWWYLGAPVHPFSYSTKTLERLLRAHRFSVVKVTYNSDYSGILGSFQIWLNRNAEKRSTEGALIHNVALKLVCQWAAKLMDLLRQGDAIELTAIKSEANG